MTRVYFARPLGWLDTAVYHRSDLCADDYLSGPALIVDGMSTVLVEPEWEAQMLKSGDLVIVLNSSETAPASADSHIGTAPSADKPNTTDERDDVGRPQARSRHRC